MLPSLRSSRSAPTFQFTWSIREGTKRLNKATTDILLKGTQKQMLELITANAAIPELTEQSLPGVNTRALQGLNQFRKMVVFARSVARYKGVQDTLKVFLDAVGYRLKAVDGASKAKHISKLTDLVVRSDALAAEFLSQMPALEDNPTVEDNPKVDGSPQGPIVDALQDAAPQEPPQTPPDDTSLPALKHFFNLINQLKLQSSEEQKSLGDQVRLMTIHASKGTEAPHVVLTSFRDGNIPLSHNTNLEEEKRLVYVGITRAMECMYIIGPRQAEGTQPSRFLEALLDLEATQPGTISFDAISYDDI